MMKSHAVPLCPTWDLNHPLVQHMHKSTCICYLSISHSVTILATIDCGNVTVFVFRYPLFYLIMAQKCKNSDADNFITVFVIIVLLLVLVVNSSCA
jgi:hypothetical protein